MSLAIQTELEVIDYTLCPAPANLQPGKYYRLTGLSQGSLGNFDAVAAANTSTQFSNDVKVFPASASANDSGWAGTLDFDTCQLTYLHDNKNNRVAGTANIGLFPWFPPLTASNVADNVVEAVATLNLGGNSFEGQFKRNQVITTASITVSGAALTNRDLILNDNIWKRVSFSISDTIITKVAITANSFLDANSIVVNSAGTTNDVTINNNLVSNNGSIEFGGLGVASITDNTIEGGFLSVTPQAATTHTFSNNHLAQNGTVSTGSSLTGITFTGNWIGGPVTLTTADGTLSITNNFAGIGSELLLTLNDGTISLINNTILGHIKIDAVLADTPVVTMAYSTIMSGGSSGASYDFQYILGALAAGTTHDIYYTTQLSGALSNFNVNGGNGSVNSVVIAHNGYITSAAATAPQLSNVYVESGSFNYAGFSADNVRLQGANTVLIAPVSNAKKDGYIGVLP